MSKDNILIGVFLAVLLGSSVAFGMGEKPDFEVAPKPVSTPTTNVQTAASSNSKTTSPALSATANFKLSADELYDLERQYQDQLKQKQFEDAFVTLQKIPETQQSRKMMSDGQFLKLFKAVQQEVASANPLFKREDSLDERVQKNINKLYREAQYALIQGQNDIARDLLIQILFLDRRNLKAKKLLEMGLELRAGMYKVEDMEAKYWSKSSTMFYGGNYSGSVDALTVLQVFDKENPLIYERLGSSYYMMGEKRKAVDSWNTALYFKPNPDLEKVVQKAKEVIVQEESEAKEQALKAKKAQESAKATQEDMQLFGIYKTQNEAYNFAGELKKQGMNPIVEETDNGRFAVKVPKSQLKKK